MTGKLEIAITKSLSSAVNSPYIFYGLAILIFCSWWKFTELKNPSGLPVVGRRWYELGHFKARQRFRDDCVGLVKGCLEKVSGMSNLTRRVV